MNRSYQESRRNLPEQTQQIEFSHPQRLSQLAAFAIVGQVILLASAWFLPFVSEYRLVGDNISEMVLGRFGFVQTVAFVIAGLGTLGLAFVIRQLTRDAWGSFIGSLLVAIYGVGAILVAIFPTDQIGSPADVWSQSTTGMIHIIVSLISFPAMILGMFVLARTFAKDACWRALLPWVVLFPAGTLALFIVQGEGPLVGLLQRAMVSVISGWMLLVAIWARKIVVSGELTSGEPQTLA